MNKMLTLFNKPEFNPNRLGNLNLWLDSNDLASITRDGFNKVSQWNDKSGNNNHATQTTAVLQPTYTIAAINNKSSLIFSASSMSVTDNPGLRPGIAGITIFIATRNNSDNGTEFNILRKWGGAGNLGYLINYHNAATPDKISFGICDDGTNTAFVLPNQPSINSTMVLQFKGKSSASATSEFFINGISSGTSAKNTFASTSNILIGTAGTGNFYIAEIIMYMRELSVTESFRVERYLYRKWGL